VGVGQGHGGGEQAGLADPLQARQLAVAVENVPAGKDRLGPDSARVWNHDGYAGSDRAAPDHERPIAFDQSRVADPNTWNIGDGVLGPRAAVADHDPEIPCAHHPAGIGGHATYHRRVIGATPPRSIERTLPAARRPRSPAAVRLVRLPDLDDVRPIDAAERFRDLPGMALLESARPGRRARWSYLTADPVAVLEQPSPGADPFRDARGLVSRLAPERPGLDGAPPFLGGLVGYVGYDLGRSLERMPSIAVDDQDLPVLRLGLHDWVIAWDRSTGYAWLGGRTLDGRVDRLDERLEAVLGLIAAEPGEPGETGRRGDLPDEFVFRSGLGRQAFEQGVERIRTAIANGEIYQANLARRLETPFAGDPWELYRRLRTGDPALFAAYLDLGSAPADDVPRAILSASPEPFLSVDSGGDVATDPIKGTRPRGRTREDDRRLACELLASDKDCAENVMIVDVLRNDLGRVCRPGSVRVPRLLRLERTATVQHLVTTVTGRLARGRDAFDLLRAGFPGGSITGAPKIRAMEILERLEPVRRGPYTGALGWIGPDGAMATSILIRTFVADGHRLTLHVGGGITWGSDPGAEWDETVAKAAGPLGAIGGREVEAPAEPAVRSDSTPQRAHP
jgi:para-aminobenzoate synthetase component 1